MAQPINAASIPAKARRYFAQHAKQMYVIPTVFPAKAGILSRRRNTFDLKSKCISNHRPKLIKVCQCECLCRSLVFHILILFRISIFVFSILLLFFREQRRQLFHISHCLILLCRAHLLVPFRRVDYHRPETQVAGHACRRDILAQRPPQALVDFLLRVERLVPGLIHVHLPVPRAFGDAFSAIVPASFSLAIFNRFAYSLTGLGCAASTRSADIAVSKSKTFSASARKAGCVP